MSTTPDKLKAEIVKAAREALVAAQGAESEALYTTIIAELDKFYGGNQKEMAAALQSAARVIEAEVGCDEAMEFKQRTCETMLRVSMQARHRGGDLARIRPTATPPEGLSTLPFKELAYIYVSSNDFERDLAYYKKILKAASLWACNEDECRTTGLRLADGPLFVLTERKIAGGFEPVFYVDNLQSTVAGLKKRGWTCLEVPSIKPRGSAFRFADPSGNMFSILQK